MKTFDTKIEGHTEIFHFECHENTEPICIGDKFLFFFCGIADVQVCDSEAMEREVNFNDKKQDFTRIDLTFNFWKDCYKIKTTNFVLNEE